MRQHKRRHWIFAVDPRHYHWDTLFVKSKEMWRGAGTKPGILRRVRQVRRGDRVLCYHGAPERAIYAIAEVTREPYPDPLDPSGKSLTIDLRAVERLPRQIPLAELKKNKELRKLNFLKDVRATVSPVRDAEYEAILKMAGIFAQLGIPLP
jgi:predicted RNA-binding protein with PUA-like domain